MSTTGETVGMSEWIIDDTCLVSFIQKLYESGANIMGILPGKHFYTADDKPVLIGAHWDVIANTTGFNDNGSGVVAMLEVMRVLAQAKCFKVSLKWVL